MERTEKLYPIGEIPPIGVVPKKMYAWTIRTERLGTPESAFKVEIVDVPEVRDDDILICNMAVGVNYNGVWASLGKPKNVINDNGNYGDIHRGFHICGSESGGIVYAVGKNVTKFKVGDKVIAGGLQYDKNCPVVKSGVDPVASPTARMWGYEANWGAFAQFSRVLEVQLLAAPPEYNWYEDACISATGVTAYRMLTHWEGNQLQKGDVVLVWGGAGGLGHIAIQLVHHLGGIPIAVVSSEERGELCMKFGAKGYINRTEFDHWGPVSDFSDPDSQRKWLHSVLKFRRKIWKIVGEKKLPKIVFEHSGEDTLPTSLFVCDTSGMVVLCGATSGYTGTLDLRHLWLMQKRIQGSHGGTQEEWEEFYQLIKKYDIRPYVSKVYEWDELAIAHQELYEGKNNMVGKLAIKVGIR